MVTELLINKLREKIKLGLSEGAIKSALMMEGWSLVEIEEAMDREMKGIVVEKPKENKKTSIFVYLGLTLLGLGIAAGAGFAWLKFGDNLVTLVTTDRKPEVTPTVTPTPTVAQARPVDSMDVLLSTTEYISEVDRYKIRPPKGWEIDISGKLGAPVFFFGPEASASGKFVYRPNINVMTANANNNLIENFATYYLDNLRLKLEGFEIKERRELTVSGRKMIIVRSMFFNQGEEFVAISLIALDNDKAYVITGTSLDSGYAAVKQEMDLSIYSFNFL